MYSKPDFLQLPQKESSGEGLILRHPAGGRGDPCTAVGIGFSERRIVDQVVALRASAVSVSRHDTRAAAWCARPNPALPAIAG